MVNNYDEYKKLKEEKYEEYNDLERIGERYYLNYKDLFPSNEEQYNTFIEELNDKRENKYNYLNERYNYFLDKLFEFKTIVEYKGNGIYKDLLTGYYISNYLSDNKEECIKVPFYWNNSNNNNINDNIEDLDSYSYKDIICSEIENKSNILIEELYNSLLKDNTLSSSKKEKIVKEKELYDKSRIGNIYVIKYNDLESTINNDINNYTLRTDYEFVLPFSLTMKYYTIIEYLGNNLYKDLTTGNIYTDKEVIINFDSNGDRVDYSQINFDDYLFALNYPIRFLNKDKEVVNDFHLLNIYRSDIYNNKNKICKCYDNACGALRAYYERDLRKMYDTEYKKQYDEAKDEYDKFLKKREEQDSINEIKKIYKLNI